MPAAAVQTEPETAVPPSSVHHEETSAAPELPFSYREKLIASCESEYDLTARLYDLLDDRDGRHRWLSLRTCRNDAFFAVRKRDRKVVVLSSACRLRWCPLCSRARSKSIASAVIDYLRNKRIPKVLTLTLKHSSESLSAQITRLYSCFRRLRSRKSVQSLISGGIWFFQIKVGASSGEWHPHLHCLLDSDYIPQQLLKKLWHEITVDSDIVDIRAIYKAKTAAEYVSRYCARPCNLTDIPLDKHVELHDALSGRRICGKWGNASSISFDKSRDYDESEYVRLLSWEAVREKSAQPGFYSVLVECFRTGNPLPLEYDLDDYRPHFSLFDIDSIPQVDANPPPSLFD